MKKLIFKISLRRKCGHENNFDAKLSDYWQKQYEDMFRRWR